MGLQLWHAALGSKDKQLSARHMFEKREKPFEHLMQEVVSS